MTAPVPNPVVKRLLQIAARYDAAAVTEGVRLIRFRVPAAAADLVEAFLAAQQEPIEPPLAVPDLFVSLPVAFPSPPAPAPTLFWQALAEEFAAQVRESASDLEDLDLDTQWSPPQLPARTASADAVAQLFGSFQRYYADQMRFLSVVLPAGEVETQQAYAAAIVELVERTQSDRLRWIIVEIAEYPWFADATAQLGSRMATIEIADTSAAMIRELLAASPGGTPGHVFRRAYVDAALASQAGDVALTSQFASTAMGVASTQHWPALATVSQMLVAAAQFSSGDAQAAANTYHQAAEAARLSRDPAPARAGDEPPPSSTADRPDPDPLADPALSMKAEINARFGEGAMYFGSENWTAAIEAYAPIVHLADSLQDPFSAFEASRMSTICAFQTDAPQAGFAWAEISLQRAALLPPEQRTQGVLPSFLARLQAEVDRHPQEEWQSRLNEWRKLAVT